MSKIIYLDTEELLAFVSNSSVISDGYAYEWEGEDVVHLHTTPLLHSYGAQSKAFFHKTDDCDIPADATYSITVGHEADGSLTATVKRRDGELWCDEQPQFIPARSELYSRSKGILEVDILNKKRVMIVGLGSFGSQIAIELAKAGVGHFSLSDFDRVELHNLARHTATIKDLGRLKTDVIAEAIKGKNPYAEVDLFNININEHLDLMEEEVAKADIVICATDNNESRFNLSTVLIHQQKIGIFGRAVTRAEGGDVFRYRPGGPCYCCLVGNAWYTQSMEEVTNVQSARRNGQIAAYVSEADADAMVQVGLSADIEPICNLMVKLTLMELSRGKASGISCLEEELVYDYYMWANRRERRHRNWAPMPGAGAKPTIMRWYGARVERNEECSLCSQHEAVLDEGEEYADLLGDNDLSDVSLE